MSILKNKKQSDYTIIVGCGRLGANLANTLSEEGENVLILDKEKEAFRKLSPSFGGLTVEGDGTDLDVLKKADISRANAVIAVTNNDNTNILIAVLLLLLRGKWRQAMQVSEVRFLFLLMLIFVPLMALSLSSELGMGFGEGLRHGLFNAASALSTTGYATVVYESWPACAIGLMTLLMLIGGGIGSTAGGLKLTRVYLILRMIGQNMKRKLLPQRCVDAPTYVKAQGRTKIDAELCSDTVGFVGCYLLLFVAGALILTLTAGCDLEKAMFEFASALGTVGLSIGLTGPATNNAPLIVEMIGMILGRLEIFIVLTGAYYGLHEIRFLGRKLFRTHHEKLCRIFANL